MLPNTNLLLGGGDGGDVAGLELPTTTTANNVRKVEWNLMTVTTVRSVLAQPPTTAGADWPPVMLVVAVSGHQSSYPGWLHSYCTLYTGILVYIVQQSIFLISISCVAPPVLPSQSCLPS